MPRREAAGWPGRSLAQRMRSSARSRRRCRSLRSGQLPAAGVGGEAGDPPPVTFDRPQLRAGVRHFAAGDDVGARRPSGQVQQPGQLGHVGALARFAVAVVGRGPCRLREPVQGVGGSCQVFCVMPCLFGFRGRVRGRSGLRRTAPQQSLPRSPIACAQLQQPPAPPATLLRRAVETPTVTLIRGRLPRLAA
jgi:hypothetical protein